MRYIKSSVAFLILIINFAWVNAQQKPDIVDINADSIPKSNLYHSFDDSLIQYIGRIDRKGSPMPRFWQPGVYITARFNGNLCEVLLNDEVLYGTSHNYIEVVIDGREPVRLQIKWKNNEIKVSGLNDGDHTVILCKNTEAGIGYLEFAGIHCKKLLGAVKAIKEN